MANKSKSCNCSEDRAAGLDLHRRQMQDYDCLPCMHLSCAVSGLLRYLTLLCTPFSCALTLFLEMAQLSSYDSPDTPETDDSVEVKTSSFCPNPGGWDL